MGWGTRLGNDEKKSTSAVMNAKNWGTLSPMPMTKLAIMCNMKLRLFWDKGRDTIMNILTLSVSEKNVHPGFFGIHLSKVMKRAM